MDDISSEVGNIPMLQINLLPGAIAEILSCATRTRTLTKADRYGLLAAILEDSLEEEERNAIDRILRSLYRGRIQVVDDISVVL